MVSDEEPVIVLTRKDIKNTMLAYLKSGKIQSLLNDVMGYLGNNIEALSFALAVFTVSTYESLEFIRQYGTREDLEENIRRSKIITEVFKENVDRMMNMIEESVRSGRGITFISKGGQI